jgi:hypothetical protein
VPAICYGCTTYNVAVCIVPTMCCRFGVYNIADYIVPTVCCSCRGYNVVDCIVPAICYGCRRYKDKHYKCKGEETSFHFIGKHKMKGCAARENEQKFTNFITYKNTAIKLL